MSSNRRWSAFAAGLALVLALGACGGSGSPTGPNNPPPTPAPTPTPPVVVGQGGGPLEVDFLARVPFTTTQAGTLDITLDWTFAANDLDIVLVRGDCSFDDFIAELCPAIASSFSTTAKPEKVRFPGAAAGAYTFFVGNNGPADESASYQILLLPGASSAANSRSSERVPERFRRYRRGPDFQ
jgi:hypothetical protein